MTKITVSFCIDDSYDNKIKELVENANGYLALHANPLLITDRGTLMTPIEIKFDNNKRFYTNIQKIEEKDSWSTIYENDNR